MVKLFPYLGGHTEYRAHLSLLVAYHRQGVVFTKVHRIWQYEQTRLLKPILEDLAARRAAAKSESMKAACKLSANALYGMTILHRKDWRSWVLSPTRPLGERRGPAVRARLSHLGPLQQRG